MYCICAACMLHLQLRAVYRRGKGSGSGDEEHASPKESLQSMQPLAVGQRTPQPHISPTKEERVDVAVSKSKFVRLVIDNVTQSTCQEHLRHVTVCQLATHI